MDLVPSFLTAARFFATDSLKPSWAALYDVDDTATLLREGYPRLRASRSPREADLIPRLEYIDRRTCDLLYDSGESQLTSSLASRNPTKFVVTHDVSSMGERDSIEWAEKTSSSLTNVEGWVRTRTFRCLDTLKTGTAVTKKGSGMQPAHNIIVVHGIMAQTRLFLFSLYFLQG